MEENKSSRVDVVSVSPKILKSTVEEIRIHLFNMSLPERAVHLEQKGASIITLFKKVQET